MIRMICGACRTTDGIKRPSDPPFSMSPDEEKALVERKVAVYATEETVATPPVDPAGSGEGTTTPGTEEPPAGPPALSADELPSSAETLGIVDGHFVTEDLEKMSNANLKALAVDLGLDPRKCKNKADYIALLVTVEITVDDDEDDDGEEEPPAGTSDNIVQ